MAILILEGFELGVEDYRWDGGSSTSVSSVQGRHGAGSSAINMPGSRFRFIDFPDVVTSGTLVMGLAWRQINQTTLATSNSNWARAAAFILEDVAGSRLVSVGNGSDGNSFRIDSNVVHMWGATDEVWHYVEAKVELGSPATVTFRLDGDIVYSDSPSNITEVARLRLGGISGTGSATRELDDVYVLTGGDFLGDVRIYGMLPSADGAHTDWVPSTGTDLFATVNDWSDEATWLTGTPGDVATFTSDSIPADISIHGVSVEAAANLPDGGLTEANVLTRVSATDYHGDTTGLTGSLKLLRTYFQDNPNTTSPWTPAEVNAAEFGIRATGS